MRDSKRYYPISEVYFSKQILPLLKGLYKKAGRPSCISHYDFFCAVLYVLRTGIPWRDLPEMYGNWHTIYTRFNRWSQSGWIWQLLHALQSKRQALLDITWLDSTTVNLHRHGSGALKK
jgi:transposase